MAHKTQGNGQLNSLARRRNNNQLAKREDKMQARRTVAAQLTGQQRLMWQLFQEFVQAGVWTRMRWMILGAQYVNAKGTAILVSAGVAIVALVAALHYFVFAAGR